MLNGLSLPGGSVVHGDRDFPAAQKGWTSLWNRNSSFTAVQSQLEPLVPGERKHRNDLRTGEGDFHHDA